MGHIYPNKQWVIVIPAKLSKKRFAGPNDIFSDQMWQKMDRALRVGTFAFLGLLYRNLKKKILNKN